MTRVAAAFVRQLVKSIRSPEYIPVTVCADDHIDLGGDDIHGWDWDSFYSVAFTHNHRQYTRVLRIRPCTAKAIRAFMTRTAAFNLFQTNVLRDAIVEHIEKTDGPMTSPEVWFSRVNSGQQEALVDELLIDYFKEPRICNDGDVIKLSRKAKNNSVYFLKVSCRSTPTLITRCSRLFLGPRRHSRVPSYFQPTTFVSLAAKNTINEAVNVLEDTFAQPETVNFSMVVCTLTGTAGFGKDQVVQLMADKLGVGVVKLDAFDLWNTEGKPTDLVIAKWMEKSNRVLEVLLQALENFVGRSALIVTSNRDNFGFLPKSLFKIVHFDFECNDLPTDDYLHFCEYISKRGFQFDPKCLLDGVRGMTASELNQLVKESELKAKSENRAVPNQSDIEWSLALRSTALGDSLGVPKVPNVTWDDIGGLDNVKQLISESLKLNIDSSKSKNLRRSGVVLHGPPGCGKTLIAKAVANEFKMTFLSVKGPELLNQYIGQSEQNLRKVFERARLASPSVVFFDELDSLAPRRGVAGDSGGVMDRMVSQLLAELDGLRHQKDVAVFVMGATNRPDLLDPCLLSPGRFDKLIEVRMAKDYESKLKILTPICRKVKLDDGLSVHDIAVLCPSNMSGAELSAVVSRAALHAITSQIRRVESGDKCDGQVRIRRADVQAAMAQF